MRVHSIGVITSVLAGLACKPATRSPDEATRPAASTAPASPTAATHVPPPVLSEHQKIEALIDHVSRLDDAAFIRNGVEHNGSAAAEHLRDKWRWKQSEIKTARDFIRVAASRSSASGESYYIRLSDGRKQKSGEYLREVLERIEAPEVSTTMRADD